MSIYEELKAEYEFDRYNPDQCYCDQLELHESCQICNPRPKPF